LIRVHPFRERLTALLVVALHRSGRTSDSPKCPARTAAAAAVGE
jgi:hypothetical protein